MGNAINVTEKEILKINIDSNTVTTCGNILVSVCYSGIGIAQNNIPISMLVFLTATDSPSELARLAAFKPKAILQKPFSPRMLVEHIRTIFEK